LATAEAEKPFVINTDPLLRATLLLASETEQILLITMHHIVSDGWSIGILIQEIATLYSAFVKGEPSPLPELDIQYVDFAVWQKQWLQGETLEQQVSYWQQQLAGAPALLELPTDRPRPSVQTSSGATYESVISAQLYTGLETLAQREGVTLFMTLLAAFDVLLYRYTGQADIVVGSPIANRNHAEIENLIGFFVNTLVLRSDLSGNPTFRELLQRVQKVALGAYIHQDLPFETLVEILQPERNMSHSPLFQVMFALQNTPISDLELPGVTLSQVKTERSISIFDLMLSIESSGQELVISWEYNTDLFDAHSIESLAKHFGMLLKEIIANSSQQICAIPILSTSEKKQLLWDWNNTKTDYSQDLCIHQLFEQQVEKTPGATAVIYGENQLSYAELNHRANHLAYRLIEMGVTAETLVGLCVERSSQMIVGMLAILKAGGAYVPLDPSYPAERLSFMLTDAQVSVLLTEQSLLKLLSNQPVQLVSLDTLTWPEETLPNPVIQQITVDSLAYVIYTSGSTGTPKGVMVPHRGVNRLVCNTNYIHLQESDQVAQAANAAFDAATFEIWGALLHGATLVGLSRQTTLLPSAFAAELKKQQITVLFLTTALFNQVVSLEPEAFKELRYLLFGGEAVDPQWVKFVLEQGAPQHLLHVYGPTENTTFSTWFEVKDVSNDALTIPIGRPISNTTAYVLDGNQQIVPQGVAGELCLGDAGLAKGYLNHPELTAEKFIAHPFSDEPQARLYRTGDLVKYLPDGNIEFIGRIDNQVKIRGFRIELGEVESAISQHPHVSQVTVVAREDNPGNKQLVAYVVSNSGEEISSNEIRASLKGKLPDYMLPAVVVCLDELPLTPNGKIDRRALPIPDFTQLQGEEYVAPRNEVEEQLSKIWIEVLRIERVGVYDNFFELGGHSLLATQLMSRVRQVFDVEVPLRKLFEANTIEALATQIQCYQADSIITALPLLPVIRTDNLPLSFAQQRLWFINQLEPNSATYNMPGAMRLQGQLDISALERTLQEIIRRHESLRTNFITQNGQPVQVIHPSHDWQMTIIDLQQLSANEREERIQQLATAEAEKPFALGSDSLLRATLLLAGKTEQILLFTMHHIVSDGWSIGVMTQEIAAIYSAFVKGETSPLPELEIQYADFAVWQRQWLQGETLEQQLSYWQKQLAGAPALLELPTDRPRPPVQTFNGATYESVIPAQLSQELETLSQREGVTLFMTLLAAFDVLLYRYTGQSDIVVGSPIANRNHAEIENLIGFFVNTLVLRSDLSGNPTFRELLQRVREVSLGAYAHQDLPFEILIETLQPERNLIHTPLFQVMFILQNAPSSDLELPGITLSPMEDAGSLATFDLILSIESSDQKLVMNWGYNTDLFDAHTILSMANHFEILLKGITKNPNLSISTLPILTEAEQQKLLVNWNDTKTDYPQELCIYQLFEVQVEKTPDAIAVVCGAEQLTYQELNTRANQLAHYLTELGVKTGVLVGLCVERSLEMIIGVLGILKAGGAYVPLDPNYPLDRLNFMISDSQVPILLTQKHLVPTLSKQQAMVCLDADWSGIEQHSNENLQCTTKSTDLAYIIYTSGSTGTPKGVMLPHQGLCNLVHVQAKLFDVQPTSKVLQFASFSFDASIWEIVMALGAGATLYIDSKDALLGEALFNYLQAQEITHVTLPPAALAVLPLKPLPKLNTMIVAGETCPPELIRQWSVGRSFFNGYGPTEGTVCATVSAPLDGNIHPVPIGKPISNVQVYILDSCLQLLPIGVPGELHIGGVGIARGYFNRPELTTEKFIPHPYSNDSNARLYKTGDLARYLPDGNIEYLGRIDNQVKIRGFRVELGEIEAAISQHPQVSQVTVIDREDKPGNKQLVAYMVPQSGAEISSPEIRKFLKGKLPDYMLPAVVVCLDELPLTPNGKIDRKALPIPDFTQIQNEAYVAPRNETEEQLSRIWMEVLAVDRVGVHDNFFELGGHSLLATQLMSRVRQVFDVEGYLRLILLRF
jgi:amino acid adenylation domain-containing protein